MNWISFVKKVSKEKGIKYNEALSVASALYHKENGTIKKPKEEKIYEKRLTGKYILKHLKKKIDSGEIYKGQKKKDILNVLRNSTN